MPAIERGGRFATATTRLPQPNLDPESGARDTERKLVTVPRTSSAQRATLTFLTGIDAGQVYALPEQGCTVGRGTDCEICVDDQAVSRRHARILPLKEGFFVEDLESTNGTFVGEGRIHTTELRSGDRIQVGPNIVLRYALVDGTEEALQRRLYESSTRDALTGAFNRAHLSERLIAETAHARRHQAELALLMLDVDAFKRVNDEHGHLAGDAVLQAIAKLLGRMIRVEDVLARYGGEEFVVLLRATNLPGAARLAERLREAVAKERVVFDGRELGVTVSIGVATLTELAADKNATDLLALADGRLYRAKVGGRDRVCAADEA